MTDLPKQTAIANEIKAALASGATLTSAELCAKSFTALDSTDISRVIGDLKSAGLVAQAGTKKSTAKGGIAKAWAWIGPPNADVPKSSAHRKHPKESIEDEVPVVARPEPVAAEATVKMDEGWEAGTVVNHADWKPVDATQGPSPGAEQKWVPISDTHDEPAVDPIEMALADLVDQADESILSFADAMLSDHPTWVRLRQMQDDAFQLLCDYRLTKTLEQS